MSSMRNAVQRRNHKERAQPAERQKWGLLEKHKDYSKRAADHNLKKRKLTALRHKASERNEDEFYYGMMSNTSAGGIKRSKRGDNGTGSGGKALTEEVVKLMKTQDEGYLRTMLQSTRNDRERAEQDVVTAKTGVNVGLPTAGGRRVVFGEDGEAEDAVARPVQPIGDSDDMDFSDEEQSSEDGQAAEGLSKADLAARRRRKHALSSKQRHLGALRDREEQLSTALRQVEQQRGRMNGTAGGVNKNGVKFKVRQRKS
ncbi:hypothetical protein LTR36_007258 [Oleoguttula mirabilis]|uniref:U3 small nucleolar RNA-associated protein 11 n=1 Tax=Oleoguttula mirabilis TaxID=1507867 RepID=A0AAV9J9W5_9PEZI|nr:hypothetical protein LTR36_007258 [Oleoguttula mirabilis]